MDGRDSQTTPPSHRCRDTGTRQRKTPKIYMAVYVCVFVRWRKQKGRRNGGWERSCVCGRVRVRGMDYKDDWDSFIDWGHFGGRLQRGDEMAIHTQIHAGILYINIVINQKRWDIITRGRLLFYFSSESEQTWHTPPHRSLSLIRVRK